MPYIQGEDRDQQTLMPICLDDYIESDSIYLKHWVKTPASTGGFSSGGVESSPEPPMFQLCWNKFTGWLPLIWEASTWLAARGFKYTEPKDTDRPPHDLANMLMLYLCGYLNRIRSSWRLKVETMRNVEVMWLIDKLTPNDKTTKRKRMRHGCRLSQEENS